MNHEKNEKHLRREFPNKQTALKVVYRKKSFPSKESDTEILQSIYFAYEVGIIGSYSNRISKLLRFQAAK